MLKAIRTILPIPVSEGGTGTSNPPTVQAYSSVATTLAQNVYTKLTVNNEDFDPAGAFDVATSKFQPTVAGYYLINSQMYAPGTAYASMNTYKNGSYTRTIQGGFSALIDGALIVTGTSLVYLNGTTDFIELYGIQGGVASVNATSVIFQASLVRGA
jgi:hypothetical protein